MNNIFFKRKKKNTVKTEEIENFKIKYKKHIFSKNIKISLKQDDTILVTMPYFCAYSTARDFLINNLSKIKAYSLPKKVFDENFKTKFDTLEILKDKDFKISTKNKKIYFSYPQYFAFSNPTVQKEFKKAYLKALKIEAQNYLPQRLEFLAKKYSFKYNKVSLRNQKTRFGSCSYQNNISLNINLMSYDFDIIDYVLIHELVHTKVKNHSSKFWAEVEKICPNYKILRKILKKGQF